MHVEVALCFTRTEGQTIRPVHHDSACASLQITAMNSNHAHSMFLQLNAVLTLRHKMSHGKVATFVFVVEAQLCRLSLYLHSATLHSLIARSWMLYPQNGRVVPCTPPLPADLLHALLQMQNMHFMTGQPCVLLVQLPCLACHCCHQTVNIVLVAYQLHRS